MKKTINYIMVLLLLISVSITITYAASANPTLSITKPANVKPGDTFEVKVNIKNNPGIVAINLNVAFDEELTLVKAVSGSVFSKLSFIPPKQLSTTGRIKQSCNFVWQAVDIDDKDIKDGTILTLTFELSDKAKLGSTYGISITSRKNDVIDKNLNVLSLSAQGKVNVAAHTLKKTEAKAATCTASGNILYYKCTACGKCFSDADGKNQISLESTVVKAKEHSFSSWKTTKAATCSAAGTQERVCSKCGKKETKSIAKLAHSYKNVATKSTLTANGKIVPTCSVCKATKTATTVYYPKTFKLSATSYTYDAKAKKPTVTVTDANGKVIANSNYTVAYSANTAIGIATAKVTFKGNYSGSKNIIFKIVPGQVTSLKASSVATTSINLSWAKVNGAKYYKVEQSADGKTWKVITTTDKTNYTVSKLSAGSKHQFRVTALDSTKKIAGKVSSVLKTGTKTVAPAVILKSTKSKTATATWKKVTGASKYIVYKSTDNKKWTKVGETIKLTYNLTMLTGGKKIYVKVVAVNAYKVNSADSKVVSANVKK